MGNIKKQGIANTLITFIGVGIGFLYTLVIQPRVLTPENLGLVRFLVSTSVILSTIFPIGLGSFTIKYFPLFRNEKNGHNGYLRLLIVMGLLGFITLLALLLASRNIVMSWYSSSDLIQEYLEFVLPISFCMGFVSLLNVFCMALFRSSVPTLLNEVYIRVFHIGSLGLYYIDAIDFQTLVYLFLLAFATQLIFLVAYILKIDLKSFSSPVNWSFLKAQNVKPMMKYILLLAPASIASMALRQIDVAMLGSDLNNGNGLINIAVYTIAFTIGTIVEVPANALAKIADSKLSDAIHRNDRRLIEEVYYKSTRILTVVGVGLLLLILSNLDNLFFFLPADYSDGKYVIIIISITALVNMATGMNSALIYYSNNYAKGVLLLVLLIVVSIGLNYWLIPVWGIEGSAIATGSSLILFNLFKTLLVYKSFSMQPFRMYAVKAILLFVLCFVVNLYIPKLDYFLADIALRTTVLLLLYSFGVYLFKMVPEFQICRSNNS